MAIDTGHGATITFGTTGGTWLCRQISGPEVTKPPVDTSYLGTSTKRTKMAADLEDWGPITMRILFQGSQGLPARSTTAETVTITHPTAAANTSPANLAGTALINRVKYPDFQTNEMQEGEIEFTYDGVTGPTWTAAS